MHSAAHLQPQPPLPAQSGAGQNTQGNIAPAQSVFEIDNNPAQLVGISAAWRKLMMQTEMAAPHLQVATIEGEHGVGKHTLARYLYRHSALGASTFQRRDAREWLATDADPSSLSGFTYLDRVDLLAPPGQGLLLGLLRSLQDRAIDRAIDRAPTRAVLLAGSETSLRQMASQGLLLPDLAFRLTAIRFAIPPLRMRREDVAPLTQSLLERLCARYKQRPVQLGPGTLARLLQHTWPGNVRELASVLEAALLEAENGLIRATDLAIPDASHQNFAPHFGSHYASHSESNFPASNHMGSNPLGSNPASNSGSNPGSNFDTRAAAHPQDLTLDVVIRRHVQFVLDLNRGNKLRAARQLAISRSTLYRILANQNFLAR